MRNGALVATFASLFALTLGCSSSDLGAGGATGGTFGSGGTGQTGGTGGAAQTGGAAGTVAHDGGAAAAYANQLATARAAWAAAKPTCPDYRYQSRRRSVFGYCATTTVEIAEDEPVDRSFIAGYSSCSPAPDAGLASAWSEVGASQIGTHADGDPPRTVEQLIDACGQILASDPSKYELFAFAADSNGVPTWCAATLRSCVDDCTDRIEILSFSCETADAGRD